MSLDYYRAGNVFFAPLQRQAEKIDQAIRVQDRNRLVEAMNPTDLNKAIIRGINDLGNELRFCLKMETLYQIQPSLETIGSYCDKMEEYWGKVRHYQRWWWLDSISVGTAVGLHDVASSTNLISICLNTIKAFDKVGTWGNRVDEEHKEDFIGLLESYDIFIYRTHEEFEYNIYRILNEAFLNYMNS